MIYTATKNIKLIKQTTCCIEKENIFLSEKSILRIILLKRRRIMRSIEKNIAENIISKRLLNWFDIHSVVCLGVYFPILLEPNLIFFYYILRKYGMHLCLPKINDRNLSLDFISWMPDDFLIKDLYGVSFPVHGKIIKPDVILIPCVGFNRSRVRLGYGGGYYDRTLARYKGLLNHKLITIGIAYTHAQVDFVSEIHDMKLDVIITN